MNSAKPSDLLGKSALINKMRFERKVEKEEIFLGYVFNLFGCGMRGVGGIINTVMNLCKNVSFIFFFHAPTTGEIFFQKLINLKNGPI